MVEELKACIELNDRIASNWEWEDTYNRACADLIRDHGQALVEAVADAERYQFLKEHHTQKWFDKKSMDPVSVEFDFEGEGHDIDAAIDLARTRAGAGGGA